MEISGVEPDFILLTQATSVLVFIEKFSKSNWQRNLEDFFESHSGVNIKFSSYKIWMKICLKKLKILLRHATENCFESNDLTKNLSSKVKFASQIYILNNAQSKILRMYQKSLHYLTRREQFNLHEVFCDTIKNHKSFWIIEMHNFWNILSTAFNRKAFVCDIQNSV